MYMYMYNCEWMVIYYLLVEESPVQTIQERDVQVSQQAMGE